MHTLTAENPLYIYFIIIQRGLQDFERIDT